MIEFGRREESLVECEYCGDGGVLVRGDLVF